jgi:stalled ribosome alternative rescue factor ArfA
MENSYSNNNHKNINKPRALVPWNTGERVHRPKKGKGSYKRTKYK